MKANKVIKLLKAYLESNPKLEDKEVEIVLSEPSLGPLQATLVSSIYVGFDWNTNRILITPKEELVRTDYVKKSIEKEKRIYEIVKCTDSELDDNPCYSHWLGKIVLEPIVDKKTGKACLYELYDKNGNEIPFGNTLKTDKVAQIIRSFEDEREIMTIVTEYSSFYLKEVKDKGGR